MTLYIIRVYRGGRGGFLKIFFFFFFPEGPCEGLGPRKNIPFAPARWPCSWFATIEMERYLRRASKNYPRALVTKMISFNFLLIFC